MHTQTATKKYTAATERLLSDGGDDRARSSPICIPLLHHPQVYEYSGILKRLSVKKKSHCYKHLCKQNNYTIGGKYKRICRSGKRDSPLEILGGGGDKGVFRETPFCDLALSVMTSSLIKTTSH
jgi:hypothetical protein